MIYLQKMVMFQFAIFVHQRQPWFTTLLRCHSNHVVSIIPEPGSEVRGGLMISWLSRGFRVQADGTALAPHILGVEE